MKQDCTITTVNVQSFDLRVEALDFWNITD